MAKYNYTVGFENEDNIAKACVRDMSISTKQAIEVCNAIRKKQVSAAQNILQEAIEKKTAIPFKRFNGDTGHKKGMGPGRYPVNCCTEIMKLVNAAVANAQFKNLDTSNLVIDVICAQKAAKRWHYGRQRRRRMKRTNVEIVLKEGEIKKKKVAKKPEAKAEQPKQEAAKPAVKKETAKVETKKEVPVAKEEKTKEPVKVKKETQKPAPKAEEKKEVPKAEPSETKVSDSAQKPKVSDTKKEQPAQKIEEKKPEEVKKE